MVDLICRQSMTRCQTPGMCSPHGGCQPESISDGQHIDLGKFIDHVWAIKTERDQLRADLDEARNGMKHSCAIRLKKEIERLKAELDCPFRLARHSKRLVEQLRSQAEQYDQALIKMAAERDQLKAEIEALVIELPGPYAVVGDYAACGGGRSVWEVEYAAKIDDRMCTKTPVYDRASLEAAGVRVKP